MGLLDRHVAVLKSEEFVLGVSEGWEGDKGTEFEGMESTTVSVVAKPGKKGWSGFHAILQKMRDANVGKAMKGRQFPARCLLTYERQTQQQKSFYQGRETSKDVEVLVVTGIEYLAAVDLVDIKVSEKKAA